MQCTIQVAHCMSINRNPNYFMSETSIVPIKKDDGEQDFTVTKLKT